MSVVDGKCQDPGGQIQRAGTTGGKSQGRKQTLVAGGTEGWAKEIKTNGNAAGKVKSVEPSDKGILEKQATTT